MPKLRTVLSVMTCGVIAGPTLGATNSYDGAYSGERSLTNGAVPVCVGQESVTAIITSGTLKFTNGEWKNVSMRFAPKPDGSFGGSFEDPAGHVVDVRGEATRTALDADAHVRWHTPPRLRRTNYGTSCEYHWHLEKNR